MCLHLLHPLWKGVILLSKWALPVQPDYPLTSQWNLPVHTNPSPVANSTGLPPYPSLIRLQEVTRTFRTTIY